MVADGPKDDPRGNSSGQDCERQLVGVRESDSSTAEEYESVTGNQAQGLRRGRLEFPGLSAI